MKVYSGSEIRNVAVVGHNDTGKTTLVTQLLFNTGAITRLGKIEDGTTVTDFDQDEIDRKHSISAAVAFAEWQNTKINLIDTPGFGIFVMEARSALRVVDSAAIVVSGVTGVEVSTERVWKFAEEFELPRLVVINKMDRERASFTRTLDALQKKFGKNVVPIQLPIGEEKDFTGVIDLVSMKAWKYAADGSGKYEKTDIPGEHEERSRRLARAADRESGRGRRHADGALLRSGWPVAGRAARRPQARSLASSDFPGPPRLGGAQHRRPRHPRRHRGAPAAGRRGEDGRRQGQEGRADHVRPPRRGLPVRAGLQDVLRSVLRPRLALPRLLRHVPVGPHLLEHDQGPRRARRQAAAPAGQTAGSGLRSCAPATSARWRS